MLGHCSYSLPVYFFFYVFFLEAALSKIAGGGGQLAFDDQVTVPKKTNKQCKDLLWNVQYA